MSKIITLIATLVCALAMAASAEAATPSTTTLFVSDQAGTGLECVTGVTCHGWRGGVVSASQNTLTDPGAGKTGYIDTKVSVNIGDPDNGNNNADITAGFYQSGANGSMLGTSCPVSTSRVFFIAWSGSVSGCDTFPALTPAGWHNVKIQRKSSLIHGRWVVVVDGTTLEDIQYGSANNDNDLLLTVEQSQEGVEFDNTTHVSGSLTYQIASGFGGPLCTGANPNSVTDSSFNQSPATWTNVDTTTGDLFESVGSNDTITDHQAGDTAGGSGVIKWTVNTTGMPLISYCS